MVENEYGKSGHSSVFTSLKNLMMLVKCNFFQGFIFTPYTDSTFLKAKNNAFNTIKFLFHDAHELRSDLRRNRKLSVPITVGALF